MNMRQVGLSAILWSAFGLLVVAGGYLMLRACDLGFLPIFGSTSCAAPAHDGALGAERERQTSLRDAIHAAEIRVAMLPICVKPVPSAPLTPKPAPTKAPDEVPSQPQPPRADQPPAEKFAPKTVEDLKGCWQSIKGDIQISTDDEAQKPVGTARFCYCFKSNGQGAVQIRYNDGDLCRAPLTARITSDQVFMHHNNVYCQKHSYYVATNITCEKDQTDQTICEMQNLGRIHTKFSEQFIRVTNEHCGWSG